jgi:hypothetical protein
LTYAFAPLLAPDFWNDAEQATAAMSSREEV